MTIRDLDLTGSFFPILEPIGRMLDDALAEVGE